MVVDTQNDSTVDAAWNEAKVFGIRKLPTNDLQAQGRIRV